MKSGIIRTGWAALALLGAVCLGVLALRRGEHVNALWIVVAAVSIYLVAFRYYSLFIAERVMVLDPTRATPAVLLNDGRELPLSTALCPADHGSRTGYLRVRGIPADSLANTVGVIRLDFDDLNAQLAKPSAAHADAGISHH